jgi:hypothetical protein
MQFAAKDVFILESLLSQKKTIMPHVLYKNFFEKPLNVVFVGGGKACHELLKVLLIRKLYSVKLNIVGVCDIAEKSCLTTVGISRLNMPQTV